MSLEELLDIAPYSMDKEEKHAMLDEYLLELSKYHYEHSEEYKKMLDATGVDLEKIEHYEDLPYLPVSLFKDLTLRSVPEEEVIKTMTSSGTTGQRVSKIFLDRETSANQTKTLTKIVSSLLGNKRVPMIILDSSNVVKDRSMFSARGAGILGFSMFGSKRIYALDENMELDIEGMKVFLEEHKGETIFLFGFTFMIWQHFYKKLLESGYRPDLSKGILIHGGGWKKLIAESVSSAQFKLSLNDICGIPVENVHDYYGMVEQTGTIYLECECGHLHASNFSDVIIRNPHDFSVAKQGEMGVMEVISVLPKSYPGHVLLTEDEGRILGEDDCPCGRKGKYFEIRGRLKNAEIRGCSDTYASKFGKLSGLEYVVGDDKTIEQMPSVAALPPFAEPVLDFLGDLAKLLMKRGREFSDVMTFGFWCRRAALLAEKAKYSDLDCRLGRGIVFHSTPSNVPVNCAFSFASGLLAGNANIVRLPAKDFPQVRLISDAVRELLETSHQNLAPYICFVKYPPIKEITDLFSSICQSRVVWGGDATIAEIRQSPLQPRANEVNFADRYSFSVLDGDAFLDAPDQDAVVRNFYNDTYFSDQNACTAPRIIVWLGARKAEAKELFWKKVLDYAREHYSISPVQTIGKMNALYKAAVHLPMQNVTVEQPLLTRIQVDTLYPKLMDYRFNSGFFYEYNADSLTDILPLATIKSQTVTYYGLTQKQIIRFVNEDHPHGIDRFVPLGKSMDFTLVWDGYDLIRTLSRVVGVI
ncbi:MAG: hypothetical protein J6T35_04625 [Bacteroidales bacterium]|nr:hypothetical protein [Bacteroidales bacterium]